MIDLSIIFKNHFDTKEVSNENLRKFSGQKDLTQHTSGITRQRFIPRAACLLQAGKSTHVLVALPTPPNKTISTKLIRLSKKVKYNYFIHQTA